MRNDEMALLIALCERGNADTEDLTRRVTAGTLDWNQVFVLGLWHKVAFLALQRLLDLRLVDAALESGLPLLLLNHWKQLHRVNARRNVVLQAELGAIAQGFDTQALPCVVGKGGPLLIGRCYRLTERKMYDLDLLVARDDYLVAVEAMRHAGYAMGRYDHSRGTIEELPPGQLRQWLLISRGLPNFLRRTEDLALDVSVVQVQFRVGSTGKGGYSVPAEALIAPATPGTVAWAEGSPPARISRLADVDVLLQLALHITRETQDAEHSDWGMSWNLVKLCDLDRFAATLAAPAAEVAERARSLGFSRHCRYALEATHAVFPRSGAVLRLLNEFRSEQPDLTVAAPTSEALLATMAEVGRRTGPGRSEWTAMMGVKTS